jgi:hypothetical protein
MLLIDGVRYALWEPKSEEEEFEPLVTDHISEIFGEKSVFINIKQKMKTKSGIGSIPDGYVIVLDKIPSWHVIEMELSRHPLYDHIVNQMSRFNNGIKNHSTRKDIVDMFYNYIDGEEFLKIKIKKLIHPTELHKYLTDLVDKQPSVTVIIEQKTDALQEALSALPFATTVVEFKTFVREGVNNINVHAHTFEPITKSKPILELSRGYESGNRATKGPKGERKVSAGHTKVVSPDGSKLSLTKFVMANATDAEKSSPAYKYPHTRVDSKPKFDQFCESHGLTGYVYEVPEAEAVTS